MLIRKAGNPIFCWWLERKSLSPQRGNCMCFQCSNCFSKESSSLSQKAPKTAFRVSWCSRWLDPLTFNTSSVVSHFRLSQPKDGLSSQSCEDSFHSLTWHAFPRRRSVKKRSCLAVMIHLTLTTKSFLLPPHFFPVSLCWSFGAQKCNFPKCTTGCQRS